MNSATATTILKKMYDEGYLAKDLDNFIDKHFKCVEELNEFYILSGRTTGNQEVWRVIRNPLIRKIVELSLLLYDSAEMDELLNQL